MFDFHLLEKKVEELVIDYLVACALRAISIPTFKRDMQKMHKRYTNSLIR